MSYMVRITWLLLGSIFFEIRRHFSKIAGNSADTTINLLRCTVIIELLLRIENDNHYFPTKNRYSRLYPTKKRRHIFWYWCRKKRTQWENQISEKEKQKTLECFFLFQNGGYRIAKSMPKKIRENSGRIQFDRKKTFDSIISNCICGSEDCSIT